MAQKTVLVSDSSGEEIAEGKGDSVATPGRAGYWTPSRADRSEHVNDGPYGLVIFGTHCATVA